MTFGSKDETIFLGREINQARDFSDQTAQIIDNEIKTIVDRNYKRAKKILVDHMDSLHALAKALLEYETLDGKEVDLIVAGKAIVRSTPSDSTPSGSTGEDEKISKKVVDSKDGKKNGGAAPAPAPA